MSKQEAKIFIGGLSWETTDEKLRTYFENFGAVQEAFVSYDRNTGRPRGFGFVVFTDAAVADRVVSQPHTIDRREVEAKKALPKEESPSGRELGGAAASQAQRTRKIFVGGLGSGVDEPMFRAFFSRFGTVDDAVVMYDYENRRPRGFGFVTFAEEDSVERVLALGPVQTLGDRPVEIKRAVPRDAMPQAASPPAAGWHSPFRAAPGAPDFGGLAQGAQRSLAAQFGADGALAPSPIMLLANALAAQQQQQQQLQLAAELGSMGKLASGGQQGGSMSAGNRSLGLICGTPPALLQRAPYSLQGAALAPMGSPLSPRGDPSLGAMQLPPPSSPSALLASFGSGSLSLGHESALTRTSSAIPDAAGSPLLPTPPQQLQALYPASPRPGADHGSTSAEQLASLQARVASLTERFSLVGSDLSGATLPAAPAEPALPGSSIWTR